MSASERTAALGWTAVALLALGAWLLIREPLATFMAVAAGLASPISVGRLRALLIPGSTTAPPLASALAASAISIADLFFLSGAASPFAVMVGAAIGYRSIRRRYERVSDAASSAGRVDRALLRARIARRLAVGLAFGLFAGTCVWRSGLEQTGDLQAAWTIRSWIGGAIAASALIGALIARIDLSMEGTPSD